MPIPRAAAVVVRAEKVLVIKRYLRFPQPDDCVMCIAAGPLGPECAGHRYAVLPGGHVEPGETPEEAALRELREETTLTAGVERLLWVGEHNSRPAYYFLVSNVEGTPELSGDEAAEHCAENSFELRWANLREMQELNIYPADVLGRLAELVGQG